MTTLAPTPVDLPAPAFVGRAGDTGTRLLAGPPAGSGPEPRAGHLARLGALPGRPAAAVGAELTASGLTGRGGGGFPLVDKVATALRGGGRPVVVVNLSESEPASAKDHALATLRPHLVLDGAAAVAELVDAGEVVVHLHRSAHRAVEVVAAALQERRAAGHDVGAWRLSLGPDRYVAGEASAVARFLVTGDARPTFSTVPTALRGPSGRPTLVHNAETLAHVALLLRFGAAWWRSGGGAGVAGSRLATVVGAVDVPGSVVEVVGRATIGDVLTAAGVADPPRAVLVGGFAGTWVDGTEAWTAGFDRAGLDRLGASPGCGLLAVLPADGCGLAETARVVAYLAGESAGQCGPCVRGLPDLADLVAELHAGRAGRRARRHLVDLVRTLPGSGACRHPDGVALLVRSALAVFGDEVGHHRAGRGCPGEGRPPVLDVPGPAAGGRGWT